MEFSQVGRQTPAEQTLPEAHTLRHPWICAAVAVALSVAVLVHVQSSPLVHRVCPTSQVVPHVPPWQVWPVAHTLPQAPQLLLSLAVVAQYGAPPSGAQSVALPHVVPQTPPEQIWSAGHALPQAPQFLLSVSVVAQ